MFRSLILSAAILLALGAYMPNVVAAASTDDTGYRLTSWRGKDGDHNTQEVPSCPSGQKLVNWVPVSSYDNWTTVGLCLPSENAGNYTLTSWRGKDWHVNDVEAPTCPSGMRLVDWVPVSSFDNWTTVGLCVRTGAETEYSYRLASWRGADWSINGEEAPSCPSGMTLVNWVPISSYDNWTTVGLCMKQTIPPSCSITFDDPTGDSATMHWSSENAELFYINNVGYVGASGSAQVPSAGDYSGYVSNADGVTSTCAANFGDAGGQQNQCTESQVCSADGNLHSSCGITTCQYGCSATTNECNAKDSCALSRVCDASGENVVNSCTGAVIADCSAVGAGYTCVAGACVVPPLSFSEFSTAGDQAFAATGHLQVQPGLVAKGGSTRVFWDVENAASCTVAGDTGNDSWSDTFSGDAGKESAPIESRTTYTLSCTGLDGKSINESAIVNLIPVFHEL